MSRHGELFVSGSSADYGQLEAAERGDSACDPRRRNILGGSEGVLDFIVGFFLLLLVASSDLCIVSALAHLLWSRVRCPSFFRCWSLAALAWNARVLMSWPLKPSQTVWRGCLSSRCRRTSSMSREFRVAALNGSGPLSHDVQANIRVYFFNSAADGRLSGETESIIGNKYSNLTSTSGLSPNILRLFKLSRR